MGVVLRCRSRRRRRGSLPFERCAIRGVIDGLRASGGLNVGMSGAYGAELVGIQEV